MNYQYFITKKSSSQYPRNKGQASHIGSDNFPSTCKMPFAKTNGQFQLSHFLTKIQQHILHSKSCMSRKKYEVLKGNRKKLQGG